jgi:DNA-binding protein HU-beta
LQQNTDLDLGKHHPMSLLLEQLIAIRMMGGEAISDTAMLKDSALSAFFQWDEIVHPAAFGRRLAEMRWSHNLGLERIVTGLSEYVRQAGQRLVAIDSTVVSVFGEKIEGAERGYNPHKPGRDSYHTLFSDRDPNNPVKLKKEAGITKVAAGEVMKSFTGQVTKTLKKEGKITLVGFGTFSKTKRKARKGRNPQTGEAIKVKASTGVKFKAGSALKNGV